MESPELHIQLIFGPDDPPLTSDMCQRALQDLYSAGTTAGFNISALTEFRESFGSDAVLLGEFFVSLAKNTAPWAGLASILAAWVTRRNGRKIRLKVGDIEAEAQTMDDVLALLKKAEDIQQRNTQQSKVIHEP